MSTSEFVGLVASAVLVGYLVVALLWPERF